MLFSNLYNIVKLALLLLTLYILIRGKITYNMKYGIPLWTCIIGILVASILLQWEKPDLRLTLTIGLTIIMGIIYFLHFRKREKTTLDYMKLGFLIFIIFDTAIINTMRYLYITESGPEYINAPLANRLSEIFNLISLIIASIIAFRVFKAERKLIIED